MSQYHAREAWTFRTAARSVIFAWPDDLLHRESSGSKAHRGVRRLDVAKGELARAARSKRDAGSQFGRNHHGPRGCTGGSVASGRAWVAKKNPTKLAMEAVLLGQGAPRMAPMPSPEALVRF
jgi:hypothetical protein